MYSPKTAFILSTHADDPTFMPKIWVFVDNWKDNWKLYIVDSTKISEDLPEKSIFYETACSQYHKKSEQRIDIYRTNETNLKETINVCWDNARKMEIENIIILNDVDIDNLIKTVKYWR